MRYISHLQARPRGEFVHSFWDSAYKLSNPRGCCRATSSGRCAILASFPETLKRQQTEQEIAIKGLELVLALLLLATLGAILQVPVVANRKAFALNEVHA
jgi:hypothetical protein